MSAVFSKELSYLDEICKPKQISFRSTSIQSQLQAAKSGLGVAVLPSFMVSNDVNLKPILTDEIQIIRSFWMIMPNEYKKIDRMNLVWDHIKKYGATLSWSFLRELNWALDPSFSVFIGFDHGALNKKRVHHRFLKRQDGGETTIHPIK